MSVRKIFVIWLGLILCVPYAGTGLHAQTKSSSTSDGVYTASQAQQNIPVYQKECASCHGDDLEGSGQTPPLVGDDFIQNWQGQTLADLLRQLGLRHRALGELLWGLNEQPARSVMIFVNDQQVDQTCPPSLKDKDQVIILAPMAGG